MFGMHSPLPQQVRHPQQSDALCKWIGEKVKILTDFCFCGGFLMDKSRGIFGSCLPVYEPFMLLAYILEKKT